MQRDQLSVRTAFDNAAVFDDENAVRQAQGAEAVADEDGCLPLGQRQEEVRSNRSQDTIEH